MRKPQTRIKRAAKQMPAPDPTLNQPQIDPRLYMDPALFASKVLLSEVGGIVRLTFIEEVGGAAFPRGSHSMGRELAVQLAQMIINHYVTQSQPAPPPEKIN